MTSKHKKYININAYGACYGGNWLHILLKMSGSFGCVVTSKQCTNEQSLLMAIALSICA